MGEVLNMENQMKITASVQRIGRGGGGGGGRDKAWPPGFRFHPTDEELILYYLKRKICRRRIKLDMITETDVYKWDPEELPGLSLWKTGERQWFFFSPRDRKYPNGARSSRATRHGYWKATGKDRCISCNSRSVGVKKTLVFYKGRAPNGERTDWVMHEYTLDEEELKRCQNVKDYYALYKVYKKSGAGPKNGEQYGAPFNEEDWADDDDIDFNNSNQVIASKQLNEVPTADNVIVNSHIQCPVDDFEEFLRQVANEPTHDQHQVGQAYAIPQVIEEEETQSTMVDPSFRDVFFPEPIRSLHESGQQYDVQGSFDFTQSATSHLQHYEATEVTSAPNILENKFHATEEDFLEIDDLIGPGPIISNFENPVENLQFEDIDGLSEFDLFHDAAMFLRDMGPVDHEPESHSYINTIQNNTAYQFDYQSQTHLNVAHEIGSQLWVHDQRSNIYPSADPNQGPLSLPTSGVTYESTQTNQNRSSKERGAATSRFSSAIWSFVESIPSNPASAAENALVNRAFERMSSFSRLKITRNTIVDAGSDSAAIRRACRNKGFIFFSVLGALCAILWVLIGTIY